jgi:hypothetical protein
MPALARSASKDGELPVPVAEPEPEIRSAIRSWRCAAWGDGGDLQAAEWFLEQGQVAEAVRHTRAAGD